MNKQLEKKLKTLPKTPGVYFHKNMAGEIIYVGKAAVLNNRVRQYFQKSRTRDPKTDLLVSEIADTDWMEVDSELEALFLEAEMVRRYMPRYNILLRDDKSMSYIRVDYDSDYPTVSTTRRPLDDGAKYFGPYLSTQSVRQALKLLRRIFPFATKKTPGQKRASLHYHIGLDPGLEDGKTSLREYKANLRKLMAVIQGKRKDIEKQLEKDMKNYAKSSDFEKAAEARNQLFALKRLNNQVIFSDKEFQDISKDHALIELSELLGLYESEFTHADGVQGDNEKRANRTSGTESESRKQATQQGPPSQEDSAWGEAQQSAATSDSAPSFAGRQGRRLRVLRRIEGYDISHMSGTDVVASMVVFTNGASNKAEYRKFKTKTNKNDDFYNMNETIKRRLSERNIKAWGLPSLVLIDGGKGQLDAAIKARDEAGQSKLPFIGLAKREEQIVIKRVEGGGLRVGRSNVTLDYKILQKLGGFATETNDYTLVNLPANTNLVKLLQRIRDESHRFAVSYHSTLKTKRQTASVLEDIPTIGPATRKKLIKTFGSLRAVSQANKSDLQKVIGAKKAALVEQYIKPAAE